MNSEDTKPIVQDGSHSLSTGDADSDSPCIGVCTTLYDEICQGCGRTLGEVSNWVFFSQEEKIQYGNVFAQKELRCASNDKPKKISPLRGLFSE